MTNDETRRRFQKLLEAKKQGQQKQGATERPERRPTRSDPPKGGRTFRRKV